MEVPSLSLIRKNNNQYLQNQIFQTALNLLERRGALVPPKINLSQVKKEKRDKILRRKHYLTLNARKYHLT